MRIRIGIAIAVAAMASVGGVACSRGSSSRGGTPVGSGGSGATTPPPALPAPAPTPAPAPAPAPTPAPAPAPAPVAPRGEGRALWVSRWHANDEAKIRRAIDFMVAHRMNILLIQSFGDGAALHPSSVAPRSSLTAASGFDPLATALRLAAPHGIEVHAWMNACNLWSTGAGAPTDPAHPLRRHPEWAVVTSGGVSMTSRYGVTPSEHVFICPEREDARRFVRDVALEMATRYAVAGVHLDYIRYPSESYCFCDVHRARFRSAFGRDPTPGDADFARWRYDDVSELVAEIDADLARAAPSVLLSAATFRALGDKFQDGARWLREGLIDFVCPMIYTRDDAELRARVRDWNAVSGGRDVYAGIMVPFGRTGPQIDVARGEGAEGVALFSYSDIVASPQAEAEVAAAFAQATDPLRRPWHDGSPDGEAPVPSGFTVAGIAATVAVAAFSTDERATATVELVELGPVGGSGSVVPPVAVAPGRAVAPAPGSPEAAALDAALAGAGVVTVAAPGGAAAGAFEHIVPLTALRPLVVYAARGVATDAAGNAARTAAIAFATSAPGASAEVTIDDGDAGFATFGAWATGSSTGGNDGDYRFATAGGSARASWTTFVAADGDYEVAVWFVAGTNRTTAAAFAVEQTGRRIESAVDQTRDARTWRPLGTFPLTAGRVSVTLAGGAGGGVIIADGVRIRRIR